MNATTLRTLAASAAFAAATGTPLAALADDYVVNVPLDETQTIDATLVADIGTKNLVKIGRGILVSSADMAAYTGTITIREGAFKITTISDLGTADGGTVIEDGGTLLVDMASGQERFPNEPFTIAGTGDAAYGAAVYQATGKSNRFKLFKNLTLSGDTTVFSGTMLGVDAGNVAMNGHTLTIKGLNFTFRNDSFPAPVGNIVTEANLLFQNGSGTIGDPSKTLTVRNGERAKVSIADNNMEVVWRLVVEEGGRFEGSPTTPKHWGGDVVWNATTDNGVSGIVTFDGDVTGTGTIKASSATLTFAKPLGADLGLDLSGTATASLKGCSYSHKGMLTGYRADGWEAGYNTDRADTRWSYCAYGPGPQLTRDGYWDESDSHPEGKARYWCSRGYIWNRESTNVTYTIFVGCVYQTSVYIDGTQVYNNKRDGWGNTYSFELPAGTCKSIDIRTTDGKTYGGPRSDNDKFKINGVIANDPSGYYFTTNAVSVLENTPALTDLSLADDGVLDANNMPVSVGTLAGFGVVTNVTALTVSDSWTLAAADIANGATLVVDGALVFDSGCTFSVTDLGNLPTAWLYSVASANSISGIAADGVEVVEQGRTWKFVLSGDGKSIDLVYVPQATAIIIR